MNRRSFVSSISQMVLGIYLSLGIPLIKIDKPKPELKEVNPEWVNAQYRIRFAFNKDAFKTFQIP